MKANDLVLRVVNEIEEGKFEIKEFKPHMEYESFISCILADTEILRPTGLIDRNGKEIYEHDIVAYSDSCESIGYSYERDEFCNYGKVVWVEEYARFDVTNRNDVDSEDVWDPDEIKIIGNIYENPELLDKI